MKFTFPRLPRRQIDAIKAMLHLSEPPAPDESNLQAPIDQEADENETPQSPAKKNRNEHPLHIIFGFTDSPEQKDAIETARGYALKNFNAHALCRYAVTRFDEGWLYEIQEGGSGFSYLPSIMRLMRAKKQPIWIRWKNRAYTIIVRDKKPVCLLQSAEDSAQYIAMKDNEAILSTTKMHDVVWKGGAVLVSGAIFLAAGLISFTAASGYSIATSIFTPDPRHLTIESLPHRQWSKLPEIPLTAYVETLKFTGGRWHAPTLADMDKYRDRPTVSGRKASPIEQPKDVEPPKPAPPPPPAAEPAKGPRPVRQITQPKKTAPAPQTSPSPEAPK